MNNGEEVLASQPGNQGKDAQAGEANGIDRSESISEAITGTGAVDTYSPSTAATGKVCQREEARRESVLRKQMKYAFENVHLRVSDSLSEMEKGYETNAEALGEVRK